MSCAVFSDKAEEWSPCSWGFSFIQRVLVQIRCLSELDVKRKTSRRLPWKMLKCSIPKEKTRASISTLQVNNNKKTAKDQTFLVPKKIPTRRQSRHYLTFCHDHTEGATPVFHPTAFKLHGSTVFTYKRSVFSNCSACFVADEPISLVDSTLIYMDNKHSQWCESSGILTLNSRH